METNIFDNIGKSLRMKAEEYFNLSFAELIVVIKDDPIGSKIILRTGDYTISLIEILLNESNSISNNKKENKVSSTNVIPIQSNLKEIKELLINDSYERGMKNIEEKFIKFMEKL